MSFTIQLTGFTLGASILNVDLYGCTGSLAECTGGTASDLSNYFSLSGYSNIPRSSLNGTYVVVPDGIKSLKVKASNTNDGGCVECTGVVSGDFCNLTVMTPQTPTPTPTPTATPTVTPTPTATPVPTDTPTPTPTSTPTITPTPTINTPTPTPTVTPTPTNTPNTTIEPGYYYYALGDCTDLAYSGYTSTITGFGPPIVVPVCMNYQQMAEFYQNNNFALTNLVIDYNSPCGFGSGYTPSAIARSSIDYANETVFSIGGQCWSVIEANPIYATGWTINLDSYSPYGGTNACYNCTNSNFSGFTFYQYTATKCSDGSPTYVYSIVPYNPSPIPGQLDFNYYNGQVYYLANHDITGAITEQYCATITGYVGEYTGPKWTDQVGFDWPVGPLTCGGPYNNCSAPDCVTGRTDCYDGTNGSGTSGTSGSSGTSGTGGGISYATNVSSITFQTTNTQDNGGQCPNDNNTFYNSYNYSVTFTFRDSGGNPVVPNGVVEYTTGDGLNNNYGPFGSFNYNGSSTYSTTFQYEDIGLCGGLSSYKDSIKFRINNTSVLLTYIAGD